MEETNKRVVMKMHLIIQTTAYSLCWLSFILIAIPSTLTAQGSIYRYGDVVRIDSADTINNQLFAAGEWVEIAGVLNNDLYTAGNTITIEGSIEDDVFLAGNMITVKGSITDMLVAAARNIIIDGQTGGDVIAAGRSIRLTENGTIGGNLFLGAEDIHLKGSIVEGQSRIAANTVHLDGVFGGHVVVYSNDVTFGEQYFNPGETKIVSNKPLFRENLNVIPERLSIEVHRPPYLPVLIIQIWFYLSLLVIGTVLLVLFRETTKDMQRFAVERVWKNSGVGFIIFLVTPLLIFLMLFPIITIPLAGITGILYLLLLLAGYILTSMILGLQVMLWFKSKDKPSIYFYGLTLGLIIMAIINNLPFLGPLFSLFFLFLGIGSITSYIYMSYKEKLAR